MMNKLAASLRDAIVASGLKDGQTLSFHHHLRNGDFVLNAVMAQVAQMGFRNLTVHASSLFDCHAPLIDHIRQGVVTGIETNYMTGRLAQAISEGILEKPVVFRSHGGRPAAIASGRSPIDVAFIAAPQADPMGNLSGREGPSACGSLGYAMPDACHARFVVAVTDCLVPYPLQKASIEETQVDLVVQIPSIGDPAGIVSGTTKMTRDPVALAIAGYAARVIEYSGLLKEGFSFQTGAGGASLAAADYLKAILKKKGITGSFGMGGITGYMADMLREGYFKTLLDVQCFDLQAVESLRTNPNHVEISAERYASPLAASSAVDSLDIVVLGATEVDTEFNVNVHTDSNGRITGGSGGHSDTAAGAKLAMIVAPLYRARLPLVVDRVSCISTPGNTVDVVVTQRGIAVHPRQVALRENLKAAGLPVVDIEELKRLAQGFTGVPDPLDRSGRIVAQVEYRDGSLLDQIHCLQKGAY